MTSLDLMPGEAVETAADIPVMYYHRPGRNSGAPLVVFIPGGGHLGRVAYGYPGGASEDFIDHWLEKIGFGLLAVSAPTGAPFTPIACRDLTRPQWAEAIAAVIERVAGGDSGGLSVIILTWSLASGIIRDLAISLKRRNIDIAAFMPMAASPPLPRLSAYPGVEERLRDDGLWDVAGSMVSGTPRGDIWTAELAVTEVELGRKVLSGEDYRRHFWTGTPVGLMHGGIARTGTNIEPDLSLIPLAAAIVPVDQRDYRHSLGDISGWAYVNTQIVLDRYAAVARYSSTIPRVAWMDLTALVKTLPDRMSARVPGGHLFFIGERGAATTAAAVRTLRDETKALLDELDQFLTPRDAPARDTLDTIEDIPRPEKINFQRGN
ncbi:MAG: hypothetical protein KGI75_06890 [Rhizobiaceae bacterium]|nr:hypothetical protein [Rhizobiaceae bacterium]